MKKLLLLPLLFIAVISFGQVPNYVPTNGLVGWWPFNGNANDESGNGNNGTITSGSFVEDRNGNTGGGIQFNTLSPGYVDINIQSQIFNEFSVMMWLRADRVANYVGESTVCNGAVSVPMANSNQNWAMLANQNGTNLGMGFSFAQNGIMVAEHAPNILVSRLSSANSSIDFTNIIIVYRQDSTFLYVDGVLTRSKTTHCVNNNKFIGPGIRLGGSLYSPNFAGAIDDYGIWNRALDITEISNLQSSGNITQPFIPHMEAYINGSAVNNLNPVDTGFVNVCLGDTIMFVATPNFYTSFENTGTGYSQDVNTNIDFVWNIGGVAYPNNDTIWYIPSSSNGILAELSITDQYGVNNQLTSKIRVGIIPNFSGVSPIDTSLCIGGSTQIYGGSNGQGTSFNIPGGNFVTSGVFGTATELPDGNNLPPYETAIDLAGYTPGGIILNGTDIQQICVSMEHTYLGDLEMWLTCPNGIEVSIFNSNTSGYLPGGFGGGGTYLGGGNDNNTTVGNCEEYCFSEANGALPSWNLGYNTIAASGPTTGQMVVPGEYNPEGTFSDFIGCPINGTWTLSVQDNILADDGWICQWSIEFDDTISGISGYQNELDSAWWTSNPTIINNIGDSSIIVAPSIGGDSYTFNVVDDFGCMYDTIISIATIEPKITIFNDIDANCIQNGELGVEGVNLYVEPGNIITNTNLDGQAYFGSLAAGSYTVTIDTTNLNWSFTCGGVQPFEITNDGSGCFELDLGLLSDNPCSSPNVSIYTPFLRRCFPNQKVYVQACNEITATGILSEAYVDIELDQYLTPTGSSLPYTSLGNNTYRFNLGDLNPAQCVNFTINTMVSCNASLGETLCMDATLYPIESCALDTLPAGPLPPTYGNDQNLLMPQPCTLPWDNSSLQVDGWCQGDSVEFSITNTGDIGDGDMDCYSPVFLYVNDTLVAIDSVQLQGQQVVYFSYPSFGQTYILAAEQHPLHPGNSHPNAHVELCGSDSTQWIPDLVNNQPLDDADPVVDIYCGIVTGSYDPNDKKGFPSGVTDQNYIHPNRQLEYVIRFQNTGTDTAFTVVIRDTLEADLNIFTVTPGVSSHNGTFNMYGPRVLEWTFNNILLPDSTTNSPESNGFVTFTVDQVPDLPEGTLITNEADIYFDFNAPITTNETEHRISYFTGGSTSVPFVTFDLGTFTVDESGGTILADVTIANPDANPTSIDVVLGASTATIGADFSFTTPTTLTFPAGSSSTQSIVVGIIDDVVSEGTESIVLNLTNPTNGAIIGTNSSYTINITDNDQSTVIEEVINSNLTIYPNPTSDQITIDIKGYNGVVNVEVYDLQGRLLETTADNKVSLKKHAKGIYVLKVSYGAITEEIRVVRE